MKINQCTQCGWRGSSEQKVEKPIDGEGTILCCPKCSNEVFFMKPIEFDKELLLKAGFNYEYKELIGDVCHEERFKFTAPNAPEHNVYLIKQLDKTTKEVFREYVYVELNADAMDGLIESCNTPEQLEALVFAIFNLKISLQ